MDFDGPCRRDIRSFTGIVILSLCLLAEWTPAVAVDFVHPQNSAAGTAPIAMVAGDFNRDGRLDLAVVNNSGVSVLLGNGDGTFGSPTPFFGGAAPSAIVSGDFNNDGKVDVAVANPRATAVTVLMGNGDGTLGFGAVFEAGSGANAVAIAAGDFNRDGKLDLVVPGGVLLGNGDGTFQAAIYFSSVADPSAIVVGDFNLDGKPDVAVASSSSDVVSILLGNGDGTLQTAVSTPAIRGYAMAVGDFNGDGLPDLVVADYAGGKVEVLLGNGDGTFQPPGNRVFTVGAQPNWIAVGDLDGDGKLDLAVANSGMAANNLSLLLGKGDGTFQSAISYQANSTPVFVAVGDFNGDGKLDLAAANRTSNDVSVLLNNVVRPIAPFGLSFLAPANYPVQSGPSGIAAADFNRDGMLDLAVMNTSSGSVSLLFGNASGAFDSALDFAANANPYHSMAVSDFDGDGKLDLVVTNTTSQQLNVLLGYGDGFRTPNTIGTAANPTSVAVGDFNRDGKLDLVITQENAATGNRFPSILLGNGDGSFAPAVNFTAGSAPYSIAVGDFNRDGNPDLAIVNYVLGSSTSVSIVLGDGHGGFGPARSELTGNSAIAAAVGDFNGDGKPDLAVANLSGRTVSILLGNGDGTFVPQLQYSTIGQPAWITVGDFNRDGKLDVAVANFGGEVTSVSILLGKGDGTFQAASGYNAGISMAGIVAGDFNRDGLPDLAVVDSTTNNANVLLNAGGTSLTTSSSKPNAGFGDSVTFTATVLPTLGTATPSGTVTFVEAGVALAPPVTLNSSGVATFTTSSLAAGTHLVAALYAGDANYYPNTGPLVTQVIGAIPIVSLSTGNLTFGNQRVGTTSAAQSVTLTNSGSLSLTISSIVVSGDFTQTSTCGSSLAAGANCVLSVSFKPTASGARTGALTITDNAQGSPHVVSLTGTGVQAVAALSANSLSFGGQVLGTSSSAGTITLSNTGSTSLTITGISVTGDFAQTNNCGTNVAAGAGCTISVIFTPAALGTRTGTLSIADDAAGSPQTVSLTGDGVLVPVTFSATTLTFGSQNLGSTSAAQTITLTNPGAATLSITSIAVTGDFAQTNTCGTSVAGGGSCVITVTFTPTQAGKRTGTLSISDNAAGSPQTVSVSGVGVSAASDFNGDGTSDIVWRSGTTGDVTIWLISNGAVTTQSLVRTVGALDWKIAGIGDFDGDGKRDLLWRNSVTGDNGIWFLNGAGVASEHMLPTIAWQEWKIVGVGDFNGDGKADILWRNTTTGENALWLMDGGIPVGQYLIQTIAWQAWKIVGVGDFNGDGKADILWRNYVTGENAVWLMDGPNPIAEQTFQAIADASWDVAGVGDFDGDGKADILWRNKSSSQNAIWFMNGVTVASQQSIPLAGAGDWKVAAIGDYSGDAKADILWRNFNNGTNLIWIMDGANLAATKFLPTVADQSWNVQP